jgi:hypothetical protein
LFADVVRSTARVQDDAEERGAITHLVRERRALLKRLEVLEHPSAEERALDEERRACLAERQRVMAEAETRIAELVEQWRAAHNALARLQTPREEEAMRARLALRKGVPAVLLRLERALEEEAEQCMARSYPSGNLFGCTPEDYVKANMHEQHRAAALRSVAARVRAQHSKDCSDLEALVAEVRAAVSPAAWALWVEDRSAVSAA